MDFPSADVLQARQTLASALRADPDDDGARRWGADPRTWPKAVRALRGLLAMSADPDPRPFETAEPVLA